MDPRSILPVVAGVVTLTILFRWLPLPPEEAYADPLGRGLPNAALAEDAELAAARAQREHLDRAMKRPPSGKGKVRSRNLWMGWFRQVDEALAAHAAGEEVLVQFKGLFRNDQYLLSYDLYPVRTVGTWFENGGRADDPTLPGVTHVLSFGAARN